MAKERTRDGATFKAEGALRVEEGEETVIRLAAWGEVHPCQIRIKEKVLSQGCAGLLTTVRGRALGANKAPVSRFHQQIGQLKVE